MFIAESVKIQVFACLEAQYTNITISTKTKVSASPDVPWAHSIQALYNLHMLALSHCSCLDWLPRKMKYMASVVTSTCFVAAVMRQWCCRVWAFKPCWSAARAISGREYCYRSRGKARVANLGNKKDLRELTLRWSSVCDSKVLTISNLMIGCKFWRYIFMEESAWVCCKTWLKSIVFIVKYYQFCSVVIFHLSKTEAAYARTSGGFWEMVGNKWEARTDILGLLEKLFLRYCGELVALLEDYCLKNHVGEVAIDYYTQHFLP
jgi:hypothetical protein